MKIKRLKLFIDENVILCFILLTYLAPKPYGELGRYSGVLCLLIFTLLVLWSKFTSISELISYFFMQLSKMNKFLLFFSILFLVYPIVLYFIKIPSFSNLIYSFRPLVMILLLLVGFLSGEIQTSEIKERIRKAVISILIIEIIVCVLQLLGINILGYIWDDSKSRNIWQIVRVTGTLGNPNVFSWFITQLAILYILLEEKISYKLLFIFFCYLLVILSGSRTMLILGPLTVVIYIILYNIIMTKNYKMVLRALGSFLLVMLMLYLILTLFKEHIPYASQLLNVINSGLTSVNSFRIRVELWNDALKRLTVSFSSIAFGTLENKYGSVDNDLLYSMLRVGIIGTLINSFYLFILLFRSFTSRTKKYFPFMLQYVIMAIVIGFQAETLSGWLYLQPIFFYIGFILSKQNSLSDE